MTSAKTMSIQLVVLGGFVLVGLATLLVGGCSRKLLYYPTALAPNELQALAARPGWREASFEPAANQRAVGLARPPPGSDGLWFLFFGGNAMSLAATQEVLELLAAGRPVGAAVWAYRGYDGSDGQPTESGLCSDGLAQVVELGRRFGVPPSRVILVGQSLGTGIAVNVAARLTQANTPPAAVILLSPYTSIARVFDDQVPILPVGWIVADPYRTDRIVDQLRGPVLIIHGVEDNLISIDHGRALASILVGRCRLVELPGRGHNDVWADARTVAAIHDLLDALEVPAQRRPDSAAAP